MQKQRYVSFYKRMWRRQEARKKGLVLNDAPWEDIDDNCSLEDKERGKIEPTGIMNRMIQRKRFRQTQCTAVTKKKSVPKVQTKIPVLVCVRHNMELGINGWEKIRSGNAKDLLRDDTEVWQYIESKCSEC